MIARTERIYFYAYSCFDQQEQEKDQTFGHTDALREYINYLGSAITKHLQSHLAHVKHDMWLAILIPLLHRQYRDLGSKCVEVTLHFDVCDDEFEISCPYRIRALPMTWRSCCNQ